MEDRPTRATAWGPMSSPSPERALSGSSRPRNPEAGVAEAKLPTFCPLGEGEGREPREGSAAHRLESSRFRPPRRATEPRARRGAWVETCTKWWSSTPGPEGAQLPAGSRRTLRPVSVLSEPEMGANRAPGQEWAGLLSRKCLRSWPGGRSRGFGRSLGVPGGGREPGSWPRCGVSVRSREGGDPKVAREGELQDPYCCASQRGKLVWPAR